MPKNTSYNKVQNITLTVKLNDMALMESGGSGFVPVTLITTMQSMTTDGGIRDVQFVTTTGTPRVTEYTPTELANIIKGSSNSTGNFLLAELTKAYNDAIGGM